MECPECGQNGSLLDADNYVDLLACTVCGALVEKEQAENGCPKCGQWFATHNDDGSCVKDN